MDKLIVNIDTIIQLFNNKISKYKAYSTSNIVCDINIKNIYLRGNKNCTIEIINNCINNANLSFTLFMETIVEYSKLLTNEENIKIAKFFNVNNLSEFKNSSEKESIFNDCTSYAQTANKIDVENIDLQKCNFTNPYSFKFINTGSANSSCLMKKIFSKLQSSYSNIDDNIKTFNFNLFESYGSYTFFLFFIFFLIYLLFEVIIMPQKKLNDKIILY